MTHLVEILDDLIGIEESYVQKDMQNKMRPRKFRTLKNQPDDVRQYIQSRPHHLGLAEWGWQFVRPSQGPRRDHKSRYG